jgi:hypothetical protein
MDSTYRRNNWSYFSMEQKDQLIRECSEALTKINVEKLRLAGIKQSSPVVVESSSQAVVDSMLKIASLVTGKKIEYPSYSDGIKAPDSGQSAQVTTKAGSASGAPASQAKSYTWLVVLALAFAALRSK